jgi:serine protease Do
VGGDVITSVDGKQVKGFDDLITYLSRSTDVGQKITLTILRQGKEETVEVTLASRP